jgi:hypothetical protein
MERNLFLYWVGKEYKLISILRNLIHLHSTSGKGYTVKLINRTNLKEYVSDIPEYFDTLLPAHQADYVRVNVICKYGGIWLDSDTLVLDSLDTLFDIIDTNDGFFIKQNNTCIWNGIFGSKPETLLMQKWRDEIKLILDVKKAKISWTEIGNTFLTNIYSNIPSYYSNYIIFNGLDNMYPVNFDICVTEYINKPYENYMTIIREYQPLLVLVNSVYKELENKTEEEILQGNMPLNYFINKSTNITRHEKYEGKVTIYNNTEYYKNTFNNIYKNQQWNNNDQSIPLSGPGSSLVSTVDISKGLNTFIYEMNCKSVVDLGCGDLTWIKNTDFFKDLGIGYTGVDIVEMVINKNAEEHKYNRFICTDIINYTYTEHTSLIIIRDVIFHLKLVDILELFNNIKGSFDYIALTSCNNTKNDDNLNQWHFSERNIKIHPFNISRHPLVKIDEPNFNRAFYIYSHDDFYNTCSA